MVNLSKELKEDGEKVSKKSRLVAFLLCYIFGIFGAHRFYVGRNLSGIAFVVGVILSSVLGIVVDKSATQNQKNILGILLGIILLVLIITMLIDLLAIILGNFRTRKGYRVKKWFED